jgi:hypothetical protein
MSEALDIGDHIQQGMLDQRREQAMAADPAFNYCAAMALRTIGANFVAGSSIPFATVVNGWPPTSICPM